MANGHSLRLDATASVACAPHDACVVGAAAVVFLMLSIASVGAFVMRFMAGVAALLGCLGLLVIVLTLLLLYRIMDNPVSNFALLIVASAWAWWFVTKKRREERALEPPPRGPSPAERLIAAAGKRLLPPRGRAALMPGSSPRDRVEPPRTLRQRSRSVAEAVERRRAHHQLHPRR